MADFENGGNGAPEEESQNPMPMGGDAPVDGDSTAAPAGDTSGDMAGTPHPEEDASDQEHDDWHAANPEAPAHDDAEGGEGGAEENDDQNMAA
jgi:hypothetical protein